MPDMLNYFDLPFTDEERLVQQTTREWVEAEVLPGIARPLRGRDVPEAADPADGRARPVRGEHAEVRGRACRTPATG